MSWPKRDLAGQRFGTWTVERMIRQPGRRAMARCVCDCGTVRNVYGDTLTRGLSRSCGRLDLRGQEVGDLLVLELTTNLPSKSRRRSRTAWRCRCRRCGVEIAVATADLRQGTGRHCSGRYFKPPLAPRATDAAALPPPVFSREPARPPTLIKVRATRDGFFGLLRRRVGDVFSVDPPHFSSKWMQVVDPATPLRVSSAQQAIDRHHDDESPLGHVRRPAVAEDADFDQATTDWDPFAGLLES